MGKSESRVLKVVQGDMLWGFGECYGVFWEYIQVFNKLCDYMVYVGEELKLFFQWIKVWVVELGDSVWEIVEWFGLILEEVQDVNGGILEVLYLGDVLLVFEDVVL